MSVAPLSELSPDPPTELLDEPVLLEEGGPAGGIAPVVLVEPS